MIQILYLSAIIILPLIPAYVLYKNLPSKTLVTGPFKGLNINLSGTFGRYFLLVLLATGIVVLQTKGEELHQYYIRKITGKIQNEISGVDLNIKPPAVEFQVDSIGSF